MIIGIVLKLKVRLHVSGGSGAHHQTWADLSRFSRVCRAFLWLSDYTTLSLFYKIQGVAVAC